MSEPRSIVASNFKAYQKNSLKGFIDLTLTASGLHLKEMTWHEKDGKEWVGFPGRPILDKDNHLAMDANTGRPRYANLISFADRAKGDAFQRIAIAAIHALVNGGGDDRA